MKTIINAFKRLDWKSYILFLLFPIFPFLYQIILRTNIYHHTSELAEEIHHYNLHSNLTWVMFGFVVAGEVLFFPLIYMFGKEIKKKNFQALENKIKGMLLIAVAIYVIAIAVLLPLVPNLIEIFVPHAEHSHEIISFVRLEIVALALLSLSQILILVFQIGDRIKILYFFLVYAAITLVSDAIIFNSSHIDPNLVNIFDIVSYSIIIAMAVFFLWQKYKINIFSKKKIDFHFLHQYLHLGEHALIDAILIDLVAILFITGFGHQRESRNFDGYYALLIVYLSIPITALVNLCRSEFALNEDHKIIRQRAKDYSIVSAVIATVWIGAIVLLFEFYTAESIKVWLNISEVEYFRETLLILSFFILVRSIKSMISAIYYGLGELGYLTTIAIWTTIIVYLPSYIFARENGIYYPLLNMILIVGVAIIVDAILTYLLFAKMLKRYESGHGGIEHGHEEVSGDVTHLEHNH